VTDIETKTDPEAAAVNPVAAGLTGVSASATQPEPGKAKKRKGIVEDTLALFSSFGLTCVILLCMMVLTYFGTYAQRSIGLVKAQQLYFDSVWCWINFEAFGFPDFRIRFPGALLLLLLLAVNLIVGGIVRIKWRQRNTGILIAHFGIILMLVAGLVKFTQSTNGSMLIEPGKQSSIYTSFHEWELVIGEQRSDGRIREHLIPDSDLAKHGSFRSAAIPFKLLVEKYYRVAWPTGAANSLSAQVIDGVMLEERPWHKEAPRNVPGAYLTVFAEGEKPQRGLVWGAEDHPWTVTVRGVPWTLGLRRRVYDVPFAVRLDEFRKKEYPGVDTPMKFESDVTKLEDGLEQKFEIKMNNPMRYGGFMFSQNSWGPQDGRPGPYYTVLEVSSNPSDQWPKYACYVIAFGLLIHMLTKLVKHVRKQNQMRSAT
jgi:ResB-like family